MSAEVCSRFRPFVGNNTLQSLGYSRIQHLFDNLFRKITAVCCRAVYPALFDFLQNCRFIFFLCYVEHGQAHFQGLFGYPHPFLPGFVTLDFFLPLIYSGNGDIKKFFYHY
jgi:hypothetical protein